MNEASSYEKVQHLSLVNALLIQAEREQKVKEYEDKVKSEEIKKKEERRKKREKVPTQQTYIPPSQRKVCNIYIIFLLDC